MQDPRDDVQYQVLEHLRALREEMRALSERMDRLERRMAQGGPGTAGRAKKTDPAET